MGKYHQLVIILAYILFSHQLLAQDTPEPIRFDFRGDIFRIQDFEAQIVKQNEVAQLEITALSSSGERDERIRGAYRFLINSRDTIMLEFSQGNAYYTLPEPDGIYFLQSLVKDASGLDEEKYIAGEGKLYRFSETDDGYEGKQIPLWLSIIPPLLAIALALIFKEVIISLFAGIWIGSFLIYGFDLRYFFISLFNTLDKYIITALLDSGHLSVIIFSLMIGGMVAIISRNGGMAGIVLKLSRFARSAKSTQFITWLLGVGIFFDDYANTLIVGNTMRPVTDKFRVSREKLAYIVDSTAAPVAAIAFVTTWIGAELGYIGTQTELLGITESAYSIFINSLQYAYYPIFTLAFILMLIWMKRDFGTMRKAEIRARKTGKLYNTNDKINEGEIDNSLQNLDPVGNIPLLWYNALIPIITVIAVTIIGLVYTGSQNMEWSEKLSFFQNLSLLIGEADSYVALLWASLSGVMIALILSIVTRTLPFRLAIESLMDGFKTMLPAIIILVLAWALAHLTIELHTADFLTSIFSGNVSPYYMGVITFILAAVISFSTGSSWSTMAILYPLALPTTWALCAEAGLDHETTMGIMYNVTAVVLGGSVLGDHCSPISDTTVLSSLASGCNHIDHVRTQLPYALTVGAVCILIDGFFFMLGLPWWLDHLIGIGILFLIVWKIGKPVPDHTEPVVS